MHADCDDAMHMRHPQWPIPASGIEQERLPEAASHQSAMNSAAKQVASVRAAPHRRVTTLTLHMQRGHRMPVDPTLKALSSALLVALSTGMFRDRVLVVAVG